MPVQISELALYKKGISAARDALGECEFVTAWQEGRAMTLDSAIDFALQTSSRNQ